MLSSKTVFKTKSLDIEQFKKHVSARLRIVTSARAVRFTFEPSDGEQTPIDRIAWGRNPAAYFEKINNAETKIGCNLATSLVFDTGAGPSGGYYVREVDGNWIPGDWPYLINRAHQRNHDGWPKGMEGENLIYTSERSGVGYFWGLGADTPEMSEADWKTMMKTKWTNGKTAAEPDWGPHSGTLGDKAVIKYPQVGLDGNLQL